MKGTLDMFPDLSGNGDGGKASDSMDFFAYIVFSWCARTLPPAGPLHPQSFHHAQIGQLSPRSADVMTLP